MNHDIPKIQTPKKAFDAGITDIAWCPGCGNFGILQALKTTLQEMGKLPHEVCFVSGIGQAAKTPQYLKANYFNGLHGRSLPPATAIKASNPELEVIVTSGDGCVYGEGGNHFIHTIRRNPNITLIVHDNKVYGLTKGQASPTSEKGQKTTLQTVEAEPFNPLAVAISLDASFVARASIHDVAHTKEVLRQAIEHEGLSIIDLFQPCVTFNHINTYEWLQKNTYKLENHDTYDRTKAFEKAIQTDKYPLGILYKSADKKTFSGPTLYKQELNPKKIQKLFKAPAPLHSLTTKVLDKIDEAQNVTSFILERPSGFFFKSGQYIMVGFADKRKINGKINVPMTISSSPHEENIIITIKRNTDYTSALLDDIQVGDSLHVTGPLGEKLCVDQLPTKNVVFISGGSGITPFRSILRYAKTKKLPHHFTLLNANQKYEDIVFREELDRLSHENKNIFVMNTLSDCNDTWQGEKGYVCSDILDKYVDFEKDTTFMLCGPPPMVKAMIEVLQEKGVQDNRIIKEDWEIPSNAKDS